MKKTLILLASLLAMWSCNDKDNSGQNDINEPVPGTVVSSETQNFVVDTLATGLKNPWGIEVLPDGRVLVTERSGEILIIANGKLTDEKITVPNVFVHGQGGLMDITVHPDYEKNGWIYLSYSKIGNDGGGTTIARAKLDGNKLSSMEELFSAQPFTDAGAHFGCRIVFDGKGYMFFSSGERGTKENSQNLRNHLGKILRLHDDGRVPTDNPFVNDKKARPEIWSYGHRNPQGVVYDRESNTLWAVQHGPKGGDELNKVENGKNYGWPVITYGIDYNGTPISDIQQKEGMEQPVRYWVPSIAPCGMAQVKGDKFPNWKDNFLVGALAHTHVARVELKDGKYVKEEKLLDKIGRVRAVEQGPDGLIYVATEGPGMVVRLSPVK